MASLRPRLRCGRVADDRGFTMIELLIAAAMGLVVVGAMVVILVSLIRSQPDVEDRAAQIQDARVSMERIVRELRQGAPVTSTTSTTSQLTVKTYTRGGCNGSPPTASAVECQVTYSCTQPGSQPAACTRAAGTGPANIAITGLSSPDVFSYAAGSSGTATCSLTSTTAPGFICIKLAYPAPSGGSEDSITVEDALFLRNTTS